MVGKVGMQLLELSLKKVSLPVALMYYKKTAVELQFHAFLQLLLNMPGFSLG